MTVQPGLRHPRAYLIANGASIPLESCKVHQSKTKKGDTFSAVAPFDGLPSGMNEGFWSTATNIDVQITINNAQVFHGVVDHTDYDFAERKLTFTGRDKGSALMDKTSSEKFLNKKPEEIVQAFAASAGIQTSIDSPGGMAGKQYTSDLAKITHRGSQWTIVNELADHFGMATYMTGATLYFKNLPESLPSYPVQYKPPTPQSYANGTFIKLECARNHILGRPVKTNVRSHNHKKKSLVTATVSRSGAGTPLVYNHIIPGLTQDQATRIANKKHNETIAHELSLTALDLPGDETLTPLFLITLSGTQTAFDQDYEITGVDHEVSFSGGYRTKVGCKNKSKKGGS